MNKLYFIHSLYHNSICFSRIICWFWINCCCFDNTIGWKFVSTNQNFAIFWNLMLAWHIFRYNFKFQLITESQKQICPAVSAQQRQAKWNQENLHFFFASFLQRFALKMDLFQLQMENLSHQEEPIQFEKFMCHECETSFPNVEFLHEHVSILHEG